jgi:hypothetical protein
LPFIYTGFIHDTYTSGGALTSGLVTGVTGQRYEITGSGLYITGFQRTVTGVIYDDWGFQTIGYTNSPLYGLTPLYGFTILTGSFFQFSNEPLTISLKRNSEKFNKYNKDFIKFTTDKINDDLVEIGLITGDISKINNKNLFLSQNRFDYGYYLPNRVIENESLFINGQYQTSGELIDLSNSYNPDLIRIVKNDYGIENGKIVPFTLYGQQSSDSIFIDFKTGQTTCFEDFYLNSPNMVFPFSIEFYNVFFNGQKLTSGIHFINLTGLITVDQSTLFYTGITGNLCFVLKNYDYSYIESGKPYSYSPHKYYEGLSEIYVNGIRQSYNEDYNELSSLNLKTGVLFLEQLPDIIYNN